MHPAKVDRQRLRRLTDLPNVGPAMAADLRLLGIQEPEQLKGRDPYQLYEALCQRSGQRHDPCVIDVFIAVTRFMDGDEPRPWWDYTAERKASGRGACGDVKPGPAAQTRPPDRTPP